MNQLFPVPAAAETPVPARVIRILLGDVFAALAKLSENSVDCVVTSPPYWGLRDYGVEGQLGLERSLGEHIDVMVRVFREVRRVLKPSGTLWLNYGDCYATAPNGRSAADTKAAGNDDRTFRDKPFSTVGPIYSPNHEPRSRVGKTGNKGSPGADHSGRIVSGGTLKPKDLCMIPNRIAIALQEDGWWVRAECVWGKKNPMPDSSGRYRPSSAHEKVFLLTKTGKGYYDAEAVQFVASENTHARIAGAKKIKAPDNWNTSPGAHGSFHPKGREKGKYKKQDGYSRRYDGMNERYFAKRGVNPKSAPAGSGVKSNESFHAATTAVVEKRFLRNYEEAPLTVWPMATAPFAEAHFATFPPELVERCLKAGCPVGGQVLDPFGGSGTTALVADGLGMDCTLIELNPAYVEIARKRLGDMFRQIDVEAVQ